mmetsp:Transcript_29408/g.56458  ORF Transcript_29408/g.56458 Transcript_29408/m.56458 type:complete len:197 (-) Transcript_29408:278-868(-)|eukprot:CAMPEP_0114241832 /NCGR_PEP_ID=MMETSP0058-20121206/9841_1 /TAXON_ID=36894 /ORGANISM="Pyramimonas parkeae, CCMP726" /LENGTH=196 /DNA_ID=CAMNT_0001354381 /DNA_START=72 /DNA_END=662 /DNA_ORIENTATION=+
MAERTDHDERMLVTILTEKGRIDAEVYPRLAPITVANFLALVDGKYYDGGVFYRVVREDNQGENPVHIEVIQGGRGPGAYEPNYKPPFHPITHETTYVSGLLHIDGTLSMARTAPGTATTEIFICIGNQPELDFGGKRNPDGQGFAAFGQVVQGMDVVHKIQNGDTLKTPCTTTGMQSIYSQMLSSPVKIHEARRV